MVSTEFRILLFMIGGKLVYHYKKKLGSLPKCGDCKRKLQGVCSLLLSTLLYQCFMDFNKVEFIEYLC